MAWNGQRGINEFITYNDAEGSIVTFPSPELDVDCDIVVCPEPCPQPVELTVDGCEDALEFDAGSLGLDSLGRIVRLDVTLRSVCPLRRVALAAILTEVDDAGNEYPRGMKTMVIPAHTRESCQDVAVQCITFVLPESLDVSGDDGALCNARNFKARFIAHYIDNDYECCCDTAL